MNNPKGGRPAHDPNREQRARAIREMEMERSRMERAEIQRKANKLPKKARIPAALASASPADQQRITRARHYAHVSVTLAEIAAEIDPNRLDAIRQVLAVAEFLRETARTLAAEADER